MKKIALLLLICSLSACVAQNFIGATLNEEGSDMGIEQEVDDLIPTSDKEDLSDENVKTIPIDCTHVLMPELGGGVFLEFDHCLIQYEYTTQQLHVFDMATGEELYNHYYGKNLINMDKSYDVDNFDYRLLFEDEVIYCNSKDYQMQLPVDIMMDSCFDYDIWNSQLVWIDENHNVIIKDLITGNDNLLLDTEKFSPKKYDSIIEKVISPETPCFEYQESYKFYEPRFVCDGSKLVVQLRSSDSIYNALLVYDFDSGNIERGWSYLQHYGVEYPIDKNKIAIGGTNGYLMVDLLRNEISRHLYWEKQMPQFSSSDYETLLLKSWDDACNRYIIDVYSYKDLEHPVHRLLTCSDENSEPYILNIGKNHILLTIEEKESVTFWNCIVRYR